MPILVTFLVSWSCGDWGQTISCTNACLTHALLTGTDWIHGNSCRNAHRPTHRPFKKIQNSNNYLKDGHLMPTERTWIDGLSVTKRHPAVQHMHITLQHELQFRVTVTTVRDGHIRHHPSFLICTLPTQHPPCSTWWRGGRPTRQDIGWQCGSTPASCVVNRGVRIIKFNPPQSTEFDQRSTQVVHSIAICNLDSAVSPSLNVFLY